MHPKKIIFFFLIFFQNHYGQNSFPKVEPFLEEIILQFPNVRDLAISTIEDEVYFTVQSYVDEISAIVSCKFKNGKWTNPEVVSFSGKYKDLEPFLSPDQLRLYFVSNRPNDENQNTPKDYDIWYVERLNTKSEWSKPRNIGLPINTNEDEFYPSVAISNNLYFTRDGKGSKGKDDIFIAPWKNNQYQESFSLSNTINSNGYEFNAFIAPDETFLIFTGYNKPEGFGSGDLYISYKNENGDWLTAENLGSKINSAQMDYCPFVNMKTQKLYFTSKRSRVKTSFKTFQNTTELKKEMFQYENGLSRIYTIDFNTFVK